MTPDEIRAGMVQHPWFHHIELGHGIVTPGAGWPEYEKTLQAAADIYYGMGVEGQSVLDVGAFDGFNSFAAERAGAGQVVAADYFVWGGPFTGNNRIESFRFAHKVLKSNVEQKVIDIADMNVETMGVFDHVVFNGIVYHIIDPINALIRMAAMTRRVLSVETRIDCIDIPQPVMLYYDGEKRDPPYTPQTGWGMNSLCMHAVLKKLGFDTVLEYGTPGHESTRSIFLGIKPGYYDDYIAANQAYAKPRFTGA